MFYPKFDTNHHYKCRNKLNSEHREEQSLDCLIDQQAKSRQSQHNKMEHIPFATKTK